MNKKEYKIIELIKNKIYNKNPDAEVILFGSHARGDANDNSDWDILILLNSQNIPFNIETGIMDNLYDIELEIGEVISPLIYSETDWNKNHLFTPLYGNIKNEGIRL
jgi:predicted nucleotidyltransferase